MTGDFQRQPERRLRVHVAVGQQNRIGGFEHQLLRQLVDVERRQLLGGGGTHLDRGERFDRDAPVLDFRLSHGDRGHVQIGIDAGHDTFVIDLDTELPFHLARELHLDRLPVVVVAYVMRTQRRAGDAQHVDVVRQVQKKVGDGTRLHIELDGRRALHGYFAE